MATSREEWIERLMAEEPGATREFLQAHGEDDQYVREVFGEVEARQEAKRRGVGVPREELIASLILHPNQVAGFMRAHRHDPQFIEGVLQDVLAELDEANAAWLRSYLQYRTKNENRSETIQVLEKFCGDFSDLITERFHWVPAREDWEEARLSEAEEIISDVISNLESGEPPGEKAERIAVSKLKFPREIKNILLEGAALLAAMESSEESANSWMQRLTPDELRNVLAKHARILSAALSAFNPLGGGLGQRLDDVLQEFRAWLDDNRPWLSDDADD